MPNAAFSRRAFLFAAASGLTNLRSILVGSDPQNSFNPIVYFNEILKTGEVRAYRDKSQNYDISWNAIDAFTRTYRTLRSEIKKALSEDERAQTLLQKDFWDKKDRREWEELLSKTVAIEVHKIPGLQKYRDIRVPAPDGTKALARSTYFNAIAKDIENGTSEYEFDCETQSVFKGCLIQEAENEILGNRYPGEYKNAYSYYYVSGSAKFKSEDEYGGHAFILTPINAVIEATIDPSFNNFSPYITFPEDYLRENFINGDPAISVAAHMGYTYSRASVYLPAH